MKGSNRRLAILASAAPIFNRCGYAGTSIADILAATELEKGGLYNHFSSKEQLAVEAFDYAYAQVSKYFADATGTAESGLPRIHVYIDAFEEYCARPVVDGGCPVVNACVEADDALPFLRERVTLAFKEMHGVVLRNLLRAVEKGQVKPDTDCERAADFVVASLYGSVLLSRGLRARSHAANVASCLHVWLEGVVKK